MDRETEKCLKCGMSGKLYSIAPLNDRHAAQMFCKFHFMERGNPDPDAPIEVPEPEHSEEPIEESDPEPNPDEEI